MVKNQFKENEMSVAKRRAKYTLEFKLEAVRLIKGGPAASVTAKVLGIPKASLENWVRLSAKGELKGTGDRPVNPEQMELARLRAELARVKMERDILKKATAQFARESL
jgi:transposase-like protein